MICRRLEGEFLDYKNAIPRKNPISVIADTKALIESIDRVSVVISEKQKSPVRCLFDHDKVLLSAKTGNGEAKDICRLSGDGGGLEYRRLPRHHRPHGGGGKLPLYGPAGAAEERGVSRWRRSRFTRSSSSSRTC